MTGQVGALPEAVELTAYRVIQESLTNIRKHADCDTAVVTARERAWRAQAGGRGRGKSSHPGQPHAPRTWHRGHA